MSESSENQKSLDFDVRTRIAAVLKSYGLSDQYGDPLPEEELSDVADAVIRELKLKREVDDRASFRMESSRARYVTEWNTDE